MQEQPINQALNGIRVLDLTTGPAGGLATMMLADFGAQVLLVAKPEPDDPLAALPAAPMWQRGKRRLELDLDEPVQRQALEDLCAAADVLVCNWREQSLRARALDADSLRARHPHLVVCHISGFGHKGPLANVPCYEHSAAALTGRMQLFQGLVDRTGPVFSALQVGVHACAQSAASGILAALHARTANNTGRTVRTSLLQGLLAYEQGTMLATQFSQTHPSAVPEVPPLPAQPPMPSLYYHPAQAADGRWMQFGNLLPHLFDNFLVATDLIDIVADPDFNPTQLLLPEAKQEAFRERMLKRIQSRSANDWMNDLVENGQVVAGTYQTTQQALTDPDIVANGHALVRGQDNVQLGPVARLSATQAQPGPDLLSEPTSFGPAAEERAWGWAEGWAREWLQSPRSLPAAEPRPGLPLAGVKVLEIATIIAAPFGASLLADLGATVTKVEQIGGDPYRGLLAGVGSARVNAGKRSICVNLKSPEGQRIVLELARNTDILIHNYRPGVPERLGIGYEQLRAINPTLIYLQSNGYGPDGPGALRPSTHPIPGAALGGVLYQMGERVPETPQDMAGLRLWTRRLMRGNEVNPDPNTALVVATSALLGLVARDINGVGQRILVDMFGANAYANHDDFLHYPGKPDRFLPDAQLRGLSPTYRLYHCADDHWVFLAMTNHREHQRFIDALNDHALNDQALNDSPNLSTNFTAAELRSNTGELADRLERLFAQAPAKVWQRLFTSHQVSCLQADAWLPQDYWLHDEQAQAMQLTTQATHPVWGDYQRHGPMVTFDELHSPAKAAPLAGQHNAELLQECGYSASEIAAFVASGAVWAE